MPVFRKIFVALLASGALSGALPAGAQSVPKPKVAAPSPEAIEAEAAKAFKSGVTAFEAGKTGAAVTAFSRAIEAGGLKSPELAKALFYRGVARRAQKKPAAALSDLNAAVWLRDGLSATDKAVAEDHRQALLREVAGPGSGAPVASVAPAAAAEELPWAVVQTGEGESATAQAGPQAVTTEPVTAPAAALAPVAETGSTASNAEQPPDPVPSIAAPSLFDQMGSAANALFGGVF
jgi:hypothetical protein